MCRNIRPLFNFDPPTTDDEIRGAALQFVRKISGFNKPSKVNEAVFRTAVDRIAAASRDLINHLETKAQPRKRNEEASRTLDRAAHRSSRDLTSPRR